MGGWVALEEWKLRLTAAKVEVEVEAELGNNKTSCLSVHNLLNNVIFLEIQKSSTANTHNTQFCGYPDSCGPLVG